MPKKGSLTSDIVDTLRGALIFFAVVAGGTYYFQSSLILYKRYGGHIHWMIVLLVIPVIAGLILRMARAIHPLASSLLGALSSAAVLYPLYKTFWAVPPSKTDLAIYIVVVLGIGYIATQPLRTTFMIAFKLGRFSLPQVTSPDKKPVRKSNMSKTQRLQRSDHGNLIAILELLIGISSLALSIFSIFFLSRS